MLPGSENVKLRTFLISFKIQKWILFFFSYYYFFKFTVGKCVVVGGGVGWRHRGFSRTLHMATPSTATTATPTLARSQKVELLRSAWLMCLRGGESRARWENGEGHAERNTQTGEGVMWWDDMRVRQVTGARHGNKERRTMINIDMKSEGEKNEIYRWKDVAWNIPTDKFDMTRDEGWFHRHDDNDDDNDES